MQYSREILVTVLSLSLLACGGDADVSAPDAAADNPSEADAQPTPDAPLGPDFDADVSLGGATLSGQVTRSAAPAAGGVGHLYIAVMTADPVSNRDQAELVANLRVENADMSADNASIAYSIPEIPPRQAPYFVTAFLDDNGTVGDDPETAGPDRGDLVALVGLESPKVTITSETTVELDLVLNFNLPF